MASIVGRTRVVTEGPKVDAQVDGEISAAPTRLMNTEHGNAFGLRVSPSGPGPLESIRSEHWRDALLEEFSVHVMTHCASAQPGRLLHDDVGGAQIAGEIDLYGLGSSDWLVSAGAAK